MLKDGKGTDMKIVVAIDSFKGSVSAVQAGEALERGICKVMPEAEVVKIPIADGGEGLLETFYEAAGGCFINGMVSDPLGRGVESCFLRLPDGTAVIEIARACGLTLLTKQERNPLIAATCGVGELIRMALDKGCRKFLIGIGGSATNDGGAGMAKALGVRFLDEEGKELGPGGKELKRLAHVDCSGLDPRLKECRMNIACDVTNVLCGPQGASAVYGPQKGADPAMVEELDQALGRFADVIHRELGESISQVPGSGAAGGLGAGLMVFCGARLDSGIKTVLDAVHYEKQIADADMVITGEGRIDQQSLYGKVPSGVAARTKMVRDIPVIAVVGGIGYGAEQAYETGIDAILPIVNGPMRLEESMAQAELLLEETGERLIRMLRAGGRIRFS